MEDFTHKFARDCQNLKALLEKAQAEKVMLRVESVSTYTDQFRVDAVMEDYALVSHETGDGGATGPVDRNHFVLPFGSSSVYHF